PATGGGLPASLNSSALAHGYDITTPVIVSTIRIGAHHNPMTLCQLKSRARPPREERNHSTLRTLDHDQVRGSQRYGPVTASIRNARLLAPVTARADARCSPVTPSQRCQSSSVRKNRCARGDPSPSTRPEYGST